MAARILVVEDDPSALTMFMEMLTIWGYEVDGATSAQGALEQIRHQCPDVVMSDLVMPGMTGMDLLQAIRALKDCPVVFFLVTGQGGVSVAVKAIREGADECLLKPVQLESLKEKLERRGFYGREAKPVSP